MRALVVDDSRAMRTILKKLMTELGFSVAEAGTGIEALARLQEVGPADVALVDWNMPEMDGLEFVRAVRDNYSYSDMKIMMVSAENDMTKIARALMVGADEYAMKPVTKEMILEKLGVMGVESSDVTPAMSAEDFSYLSDLVLREAAIVLETGKEYLATSRLEPIARKNNLDGIPGLVRALRSNATAGLKDQVVDAMTTNETLWFRDTHPFESLQNSILPELINLRAASRSLDIWCAAASTGQEPYTIAMMLKENFPQLANWHVRILATDISTKALHRAREGRYTQMEMGRGLPAKYLVNYFTRVGVEWQINPNMRAMIDYKLFNLATPWPPMGPFDLVLIRNVLIYFSQQTKTEIIGKCEKVIKPGGYLMLGSTESLLNIPNNLERVAHGKTTCYRPKP